LREAGLVRNEDVRALQQYEADALVAAVWLGGAENVKGVYKTRLQ
jgi:hypothetical protein